MSMRCHHSKVEEAVDTVPLKQTRTRMQSSCECCPWRERGKDETRMPANVTHYVVREEALRLRC